MRSSMLVALLLALAIAPAAQAATVYVQDERREPDEDGDTSYSRAFYTAVPGEANDVTVTVRDGAVAYRDAGAALTAGPGCRAEGAEVICSPAFDLLSITVDLGDGDDRLSAEASGSNLPAVEVHARRGADKVTLLAGSGELDGGPGDDVLTGSPDHTVLRGGVGADVLRGGAAFDQLEGDPPAGPFSADRLHGGANGDAAVYTGRTAPVAVDLADPGPDGAPGEGDVLVGIEHVHGGRGPDVLRGDRGHNLLVGAGGDDRIDGRGARDRLVGGPGRDSLAGGPGDDFLEARLRDAGLEGGAGDDELTLLGGFELLGRPPVRRLPGIDCAGGADVVRGLPPGATVERGCEGVEFANLSARLDLSRLGRGLLRVRIGTDHNSLPDCLVRVQVHAAGHAGKPATVRRRPNGRGRARARFSLPPALRRALRRPGARLAVRLEGRFNCRGRRWQPEGHWQVSL